MKKTAFAVMPLCTVLFFHIPSALSLNDGNGFHRSDEVGSHLRSGPGVIESQSPQSLVPLSAAERVFSGELGFFFLSFAPILRGSHTPQLDYC